MTISAEERRDLILKAVGEASEPCGSPTWRRGSPFRR